MAPILYGTCTTKLILCRADHISYIQNLSKYTYMYEGDTDSVCKAPLLTPLLVAGCGKKEARDACPCNFTPVSLQCCCEGTNLHNLLLKMNGRASDSLWNIYIYQFVWCSIFNLSQINLLSWFSFINYIITRLLSAESEPCLHWSLRTGVNS